jgi:hypothetical protein
MPSRNGQRPVTGKPRGELEKTIGEETLPRDAPSVKRNAAEMPAAPFSCPRWIPVLRISPGARLLWIDLRARCVKKDHCWPSVEVLAEDLGYKRSSIKSFRRELVKHGLLRVRERTGHATIYFPIWPDEPSQPTDRGVVNPLTGGGQQADRGVVNPLTPEGFLRNLRKGREDKGGIVQPTAAPSPGDSPAYGEYIRLRREKSGFEQWLPTLKQATKMRSDLLNLRTSIHHEDLLKCLFNFFEDEKMARKTWPWNMFNNDPLEWNLSEDEYYTALKDPDYD